MRNLDRFCLFLQRLRCLPFSLAVAVTMVNIFIAKLVKVRHIFIVYLIKKPSQAYDFCMGIKLFSDFSYPVLICFCSYKYFQDMFYFLRVQFCYRGTPWSEHRTSLVTRKRSNYRKNVLVSENKCADQFSSFFEADLRLCFRIGKILLFFFCFFFVVVVVVVFHDAAHAKLVVIVQY